MQLEFSIPIKPTKTVRSVSEITNLLKQLIDRQPEFQNVWIQGEVSNYSRSGAGHVYFTLKEGNHQISVAIFRNDVPHLKFLPKDGEEVIVKGQLSLYSARGQYQIVGRNVEPVGIGALQRAYEELKHRLAAEGLFDDIYKKPLPKFPRTIGVVTSPTGAAIQDILQQLRKRYPLAEVLLHPTRVQGDSAVQEIAAAIQVMNQREDIDVLIVGRGGGPIEDLWAFNEERVARAIFDSSIPVVSAVGHETDFTIADWVADHRAPTPSAAVEHIVPDQDELFAQLNGFDMWLRTTMQSRLNRDETRLQELETRLAPTQRRDAIYQLYQILDNLDVACRSAVGRKLADSENRLHAFAQHLNALSPLATLKRGYSIARKTDGEVVTAAEQVSVGDEVEVQLARGHLTCRIEELRHDF